MKRSTTFAALFATTALAACSGGSEAPPPPNETENVVVMDETPTENVVIEAEPSPTPTPSPTPVVENLPDEQQVQEDADAVGMTARLPQDDAEAAPAE